MKTFSAFILALSFSASALATQPKKIDVLTIFLHNLNTLQFTASDVGGVPSEPVPTTFAKALSQGAVKVVGQCAYRGKSLLEDCAITVTPLAGEGRGALYIYKFTKLHEMILSQKVNLTIAL